MHFFVDSVDEAFTRLVGAIHKESIPLVREDSRNGPVIRIAEPVTLTYSDPRRRVLANPARDANPFFHMFEALWMLAGRNDVKSLSYYNNRIHEYSDDGKTFHGAYGHRWRDSPSCPAIYDDQLNYVVDILRKDPNSRRAVLTIWDPWMDLVPQIERDHPSTLYEPGKDYPCNTHVYFSVSGPLPVLDMTVCNRSNDLIWGMLGSNVVCFSFLQEYLANRLRVGIGRYHQFSNNVHVYESNWRPEEWLASSNREFLPGEYEVGCADGACFDKDCARFVDDPSNLEQPNEFLRFVAQPMMAAYAAHKRRRYRGDHGALVHASHVQAPDWRHVAEVWIKRRMEAWENRLS